MRNIIMPCVYPSNGVVFRFLEWSQPTTSIPLLRTQLYYMVCIFFRLALFNLVFVLRKEWYMPVFVGIGSFLSVVHLSFSAFRIHQNQWWSKKFQWVISILVLCGCILVYQGHIPAVIIPLLLYLSLLGGLAQRWMYCCQYSITTPPKK